MIASGQDLNNHFADAPLAGSKKHLTTGDRIVACWFTITGMIHLVIEGEAPCAIRHWDPCRANLRHGAPQVWQQHGGLRAWSLCPAGWVVVKADFYKDASGHLLSETC